MQERHATPAERKHVSVLFADIVNSTQMIEGLDPEQSVDLLDDVIAGMVAAVETEEGRVLRLQGDGIKAVFGAPVAQGDHADRACFAALRIQEAAQLQGVKVRIGINSGEVVTRSVRLEQGLVYEAGGMAVHLAARMEQLAAPGSICLTAATARLVRSRFHIRQLRPRRAKGVSEVVQVFALLPRWPTRSRWEAKAADGLGHLLGRDDELALLNKGLAAVTAGRGTAIALIGPPGIGKSRLAFEILRSRRTKRWTRLRVSAEAIDLATGLRPFATMVRSWLDIAQDVCPADAWHIAETKLAEIGRFDIDTYRGIAGLLDLRNDGTFGDAPVAELRGAIFRALVKLLRADAQHRPVILLAEDAHWFDADSRDLLAAIIAGTRDVPIAILMTYRPGYADADLDPMADLRLPLSPLPQDVATSLLTQILGSHQSLEGLKARIVERAGGTPLFLEEMAQEVVDGGAVGRGEAGFTLAKPDVTLRLPSTINTLLSERLDRLPAPLKTVVRLAAVVGQEVPVSLLIQELSPQKIAVDSALSDLESLGILLHAGTDTDRRVRFNHALTQEAAYQGILKEDRRILHQRVLKAFETLYGGRAEEQSDVLALHAECAALWDEALYYLRLAAGRAIQRSSHANAIAHIDRALTIIAEEQAGDDNIELDLRLLLRTAHNAIGNYRERLTNLDRAQLLAQQTRRTDLIPEIMISRGSALLQLGEPAAALAMSLRAKRMARRDSSNALHMRIGYMVSRSYFYNGWPARALALATETLGRLEREQSITAQKGGFGTPNVMLLTQIAQAQACLGRLSDAVATGRQALDIATAGQRDWDVGLATFGYAAACLYRNDLIAAQPALDAALRTSKNTGGHDSYFGLLASLLGYARIRSSDAETGIALCREALTHPEESCHHANWIRLCCASAFFDAGLRDESTELALKAADDAHRWSYPIQCAWSDLLLAAHYLPDAPDQAAPHLERVLATARARRFRPFLARAMILAGSVGRGAWNDEMRKQGIRAARRIGLLLPAGRR
ncbi:MAG TPA: adenylate/guanylate cyclase domain-containing protein [Rhodopila sp.]|nr:adenylate/guanylate cyclase domain-containing protein [Rhodopila sp.]